MMHESAAGASQDAQGRVQQRLQRRITLFMGQTRSRKRVGALMQLCVRRHAPPPVTVLHHGARNAREFVRSRWNCVPRFT